MNEGSSCLVLPGLVAAAFEVIVAHFVKRVAERYFVDQSGE